MVKGRNRRVVRLRVRSLLLALTLAGACSASPAADSISGLGSAFRPQAGPEAPAAGAGAGERAGAAAAGQAHLSGLRVLVSSKARSVALIEGQIVHVGDRVNGLRVAQIDPQGVDLIGEDGVRQRLVVSPAVVKRQRPAGAADYSKGLVR